MIQQLQVNIWFLFQCIPSLHEKIQDFYFFFFSCPNISIAGRDHLWKKPLAKGSLTSTWPLLCRPWRCFFLGSGYLYTVPISSKYYEERKVTPHILEGKVWHGETQILGAAGWGFRSSIWPSWPSGTCHAFSTFQKDSENVPAAEQLPP